jgi:hypothetical protein
MGNIYQFPMIDTQSEEPVSQRCPSLREVETGRDKGEGHGLINYMDTKTKCRHLKKIDLERDFAAGVYIRVYRLAIQSAILVFSTQLCDLLPLSPSLWFNSPPRA